VRIANPNTFPSQNGNQPTKDQTHHVPESCCCLPFWHFLQSPSVTHPFIPRRPWKPTASFSFRINRELLVKKASPVTTLLSQQRCTMWHRFIPQLPALQGWGRFIWALMILYQEGYRCAGVLALFCQGLAAFSYLEWLSLKKWLCLSLSLCECSGNSLWISGPHHELFSTLPWAWAAEVLQVCCKGTGTTISALRASVCSHILSLLWSPSSVSQQSL